MKIGRREIGPGQPTLVIAELGINHNGDPGRAREMVSAAFAAGADGVKFQTYRAQTRFAPGNPFVEVFARYELSREEEQALWEWTRERHPDGVVLSTPFDKESADFLVRMDTDAMKIASFEAVNLELVRHVARSHRPVIFSTGTLSEDEVRRAAAVIVEHGGEPIPLHCISSYPTALEDAQVAVVSRLIALFGRAGYSDHTEGVGAAPYAVAAGACLVEKHFTLDRTLEGPDHAMSITPECLAELVAQIRQVESIRGSDRLGPRACERFVYENCRRVSS